MTTFPLDDLVKSHGKETADTTFAFSNSWQKNYQRAAFIDTKAKQSPKYEAKAREMAQAYGWEYATIPGSHELIGEMMTLETSTDEILVVPPEHVIAFDAIHSTLGANPIWSDNKGGKKDHAISRMNIPSSARTIRWSAMPSCCSTCTNRGA